MNRATGQHAWAYWIMIFCNVVSPQLFWFRKCRTSIPIMMFVVMCVNVGMWFERFVIVLSLEQDFLPSSWAYFTPSWVDWAMLVGSFGLFFTLFLLFIRFLPVIAIAEVKTVMPEADPTIPWRRVSITMTTTTPERSRRHDHASRLHSPRH